MIIILLVCGILVSATVFTGLYYIISAAHEQSGFHFIREEIENGR